MRKDYGKASLLSEANEWKTVTQETSRAFGAKKTMPIFFQLEVESCLLGIAYLLPCLLAWSIILALLANASWQFCKDECTSSKEPEQTFVVDYNLHSGRGLLAL